MANRYRSAFRLIVGRDYSPALWARVLGFLKVYEWLDPQELPRRTLRRPWQDRQPRAVNESALQAPGAGQGQPACLTAPGSVRRRPITLRSSRLGLADRAVLAAAPPAALGLAGLPRPAHLRAGRPALVGHRRGGQLAPADRREHPGRRGKGQPARQTKSGRSRSFPMHAGLRRLLQGMPRSADGLVFHGPRGGRLKPDTMRQALIREVLAPLGERFPTAPGQVGFAGG